MKPERFVIGVDGGGTRTRAVVADLTGRVLGRGAAGPSNLQAVGPKATCSALGEAIATALADAAMRGSPVAVCLGMAGAGRPASRAVIERWAMARYPGATTRVVHDGQLVLEAGTPEGWGVAVISGTGSLAYGQTMSGQAARAGGWGYLLGDEGSGYAIGLAALRAVAGAVDRRGSATALTESVLAHWSLPRPRALINHVYGAALSSEEIAGLVPVVIKAAADDDNVARSILQDAGRELALTAQAVVEQLPLLSPVPCALAGGVLLNSETVRSSLQARLSEAGIKARPVMSVPDPVEGAIRIALDVAADCPI